MKHLFMKDSFQKIFYQKKKNEFWVLGIMEPFEFWVLGIMEPYQQSNLESL